MSSKSFLPEDYLAQKAEQRTNIISLVLFGVVMIAVVGALLVTNRAARLVKQQRDEVNVQYQQAGLKIQELTQLEQQKEEMLNKAELAGALVERVPRSILLADLINRMPDRLALLEFELKSEKLLPPSPPVANGSNGRLNNAAPERAKTVQEANQSVQKVEPPRYKITITMLGVAPTDLEVSKYMSELNSYKLLRDVALAFSEEKNIDGRIMRQFKISMSLDPDADVRGIDPLIIPRVKNPMTDQLQFTTQPKLTPGAAPGDTGKAAPGNPGAQEGR
jgi:hypothetical protein